MLYKLFGYDISHHQSKNFVRNNTHADFIAAKATEGRTWVDEHFDTFYNDAKQAGIMFGAYHFGRPDNHNSPEAEAENFCNKLKGKSVDFVALDIEDKALKVQGLAEWCRQWISAVNGNYLNVPVYIYVQANAYKLVESVPNCDGLWIAHYDNRRELQGTVTTWNIPSSKIIMKQHTSNNGTLDEDTMYVDSALLFREKEVQSYDKERIAEINRTIQACHDLIENEFVNV